MLIFGLQQLVEQEGARNLPYKMRELVACIRIYPFYLLLLILRCHYDKVYLVCVVYFVLVIELKHYALFEAVDLLDASTHDILNVMFLYMSIPYYIYIFDRLYFLRKIS